MHWRSPQVRLLDTLRESVDLRRAELRQNFRNFRLDRIVDARIASEHFPDEAGKRLEDFLGRMPDDSGSQRRRPGEPLDNPFGPRLLPMS
jgi:hypothetical protein